MRKLNSCYIIYEFNKIYTDELANYNKEHSSFDENKKHQSQSLKDWFLLRFNLKYKSTKTYY
jgi:hypothetical protein